MDQLALVPQRDPDCHKRLVVFKKDCHWDWICTCEECIEADRLGAEQRRAEYCRYLKENVPWARLGAV